MIEKMIFELQNLDLLVLTLFALVVCVWGLIQMGWRKLALAYTAAVIFFLAVGDALLEMPTARLFAGSNEFGVAAFIFLIIGFKGVAVLAGMDPATWWRARFRDFVFISYSLTASMIGLYAITGDADYDKQNNQAQIAALEAQRQSLLTLLNGTRTTPACIDRGNECISSEVREELNQVTAELYQLRLEADITFIDALAKPADLLRIEPETLAFIFNALRSLLAMYGLLLATKLARKQYAIITGNQTDITRQDQTKADKTRQTTRQTKNWFKRSPKRNKNKYSRQELTDIARKWHAKNKKRPTTRSVNQAIRDRKSFTIDNNVALEIANHLKAS